MRKVLVFFAIVIAVVAAGAAALVLAFPRERVRAEALRAVEGATGRAVAIDGPVRLMVYPVLGLEAQGVRLANVAGGRSKSLLSAQSVAIGVKLLPLLGGDVQVKRLELIKPVLSLEVDAAGKPNWLLGPQKAAAGPQIKALSLADVRIEDGALSFVSAVDNSRYDVTQIDLKASLLSLDSPLALDGGFTYHKERSQAKLSVARPRAFIEPGTTPVRLELSGEVVQGALDGALDVPTGAVMGKVDIKGASFRRLSAWLGAPMGPGPGFGPYAAQGDLRLADGAARLDKAQLSLDALRASGVVVLAAGEKRPKLSGDLRLPNLDLNAYAGAPAAPKGVDVQQGWSDEPFDFSGLKGFDADLRLRADALVFQKLRVEAADMSLAINAGLLDATLHSMKLYGGSGAGRLKVDATTAVPRVSQSLLVENIQALPFLTDAIGLDRLAGLAKLEINLTGAGRSQASLVRDLAGSFALSVQDGEIKGLSLGEIARTVRAALSGQAVGPAASTDFGAFSGSFAVREGVAATKDLTLTAPFLRMSGAGLINLGQQSADLRLTPKAVSSTQGQGGSFADNGVGIPFHVSGKWTQLKFSPDLAGAAQLALQGQLDKFGAEFGRLFGQKPANDNAKPAQPNAQPAEKPKRSFLDTLLKGGGG